MGQEPTAPLYSGTFERSMDAKKRVAVPSAWLQGEDQLFHVIPHPRDGFLVVMPPAEFQMWERRIEESAASPAEKRRLIRSFYGQAYAVNTDKQGRILLPDPHCVRAGLKNDVVFIGGGSRFEIWAKERRAEDEPGDMAVFERMADEIGL